MRRVFRSTDVRPDSRRDVRDELQFHLEMRTREFMAAGMPPDEARRAAVAAFGDVGAIDTALRAERDRRARHHGRRDHVHELAMDLMFAVRTLRKNIGFTAAALATLALGVAASTSVFTVVSGVLLRPLPYADPARLAVIWLSGNRLGLGDDLPLSAPIYADLHAHASAFAATTAFRAWTYTIEAGGDVEQLSGARVTPEFFDVFGVRPAVGRGFVNADASPGSVPARVAIISDGLWQRRFGGRSSAVGTHITLGGESFTIIGVMPPSFAFPRGAELPSGLEFGRRTDIWTPLAFTEADLNAPGTLNLAAAGRLRRGVSASSAQYELTARLHAFLASRGLKLDVDYQVVDLMAQATGPARRGLVLLLGAVLFVLFIACANVANLLVARTGARQREFAMRAALGAGRGRIMRQLITENLVLSVTGTALGVALSLWLTRTMLAMVPSALPRSDDVQLDWRVLGAAGAVAIAVAITFGVAAALQVQAGPAAALSESSTRSSGGRSQVAGRRALVACEVGLSFMLIIGAALLSVSFVRLQDVDPGFRPSGTLVANVVLPLPRDFNPARDGAGWARFFEQLVANLSESPGVTAAGAVSALPLTGTSEGGSTAIADEPRPAPGHALQTAFTIIEGDYFRAMGIRVLEGRSFDRRDQSGSLPVVMVNREYVRRYFHGRPALGKQLLTSFDYGPTHPPRTIVGIVDDVRLATLDSAPVPEVYLPQQQMPYPGLQLVIHTTGDPLAAVALLKGAVRALDPHLAVSNVRRMDDVFDESLAHRRFSMTLFAWFAGTGILLAVVGLYGVIALSVSRRTRELGIRVALGAEPANVMRLVLGEGAAVTLVGLGFGIGGALAATRLLTNLLYDVSPTSPMVYALAALAMAIVTLAASWIPARRATRVDPVLALRVE